MHSASEMLFRNLIRPRTISHSKYFYETPNQILIYEDTNFLPETLFSLRGTPALRETSSGEHWSKGMYLFHDNILMLQEFLFVFNIAVEIYVDFLQV